MIHLKSDYCYAILADDSVVRPGLSVPAGFYLHDTRHLSQYEVGLNDFRLAVQHVGGEYVRQTWVSPANPDLSLERELTLHPRGMTDSLRIINVGSAPVSVRIRLSYDADFDDVFEARGHVRQAPPGICAHLSRGKSYAAVDGVVSGTMIDTDGWVPDEPVPIAAHEGRRITIRFAFTTTLPAARYAPVEGLRWSPRATPRVLSADESKAFDQAQADIQALLIQTPQGVGIAAGIPNFVAPFGRDSLIATWFLLDADPGLARSVLKYLAAKQGQRIDPFRDEEPGKIMHEHREGELSRIGELPFHTYYGSADATPLFLMVLADYVEKAGDATLARELEPNWRAALGWIRRHIDDRGLVVFGQRGDGKGLTVQSWKDSHDSMSYADGRLAAGPLAVAEVQGYAYAALLAAARLCHACGAPEGEAARLKTDAAELASRIDALYWMPGHGSYALALDADGCQLDVDSSDSGHLLWTGVVPRDKARRVVDRLFAGDMWSGYGLRTLSSGAMRYDPLSYHNGSVWPHDTAIFAAGLLRYGEVEAFGRVRDALVALANSSHDLRLPELVAGHPRAGNVPPASYEQSCRPQAWSAAAMIYVLGAAGKTTRATVSSLAMDA
ncbi:MAG: glycogen debranching N-terminal domain-containing protein [Devosia sp.]